MRINTTQSTVYPYTGTTAGLTKKQCASYETICEKQTKKEYKNAVQEYKQRHPQNAAHVDAQVQAGKNHIKSCGADTVSRSDMTMDEYKAFFKDLMDRVPFDSSHMNDTEIWSITEEGWEQMKNDPDYEAWVLGYTIENRGVHFPFQSSNMCVEKFGASIEEHVGHSYRKDADSTKKTGKKEESWWYKRHIKMKEYIEEQELEAQKRAIEKRIRAYRI